MSSLKKAGDDQAALTTIYLSRYIKDLQLKEANNKIMRDVNELKNAVKVIYK